MIRLSEQTKRFDVDTSGFKEKKWKEEEEEKDKKEEEVEKEQEARLIKLKTAK